jgi:Flp pilus assembly pilin Flp
MESRRRSLNQKRNDTGASLVEYALLVALLAIVSLSAVRALGVGINGTFTRVIRQGFPASGGVCDPSYDDCAL